MRKIKLSQVHSLIDEKKNFWASSRDLKWLREQKKRLQTKFKMKFIIKKGYKGR